MPRLRIAGTEAAGAGARRREDGAPIPFPRLRLTSDGRPSHDGAHEVLAALTQVSRRMEDLARELDCLGHFEDDDDDRPRAA